MELTPFFFGLYKFVKYGLYPLTWVVLFLSLATGLGPLPFLAKTPAVGAPAPHVLPPPPRDAIQSVDRLPADRLARILVPPPQLTPSDRFDAIVVLGEGIDEKGSLRPADSHLPIPEIEPPAA